MGGFTTDDVMRELIAVTSTSNARAMLGRASKVAQVRRDSPLDTTEMVLLLAALGAEGGAIQQLAETMAQRALAEPYG